MMMIDAKLWKALYKEMTMRMPPRIMLCVSSTCRLHADLRPWCSLNVMRFHLELKRLRVFGYFAGFLYISPWTNTIRAPLSKSHRLRRLRAEAAVLPKSADNCKRDKFTSVQSGMLTFVGWIGQISGAKDRPKPEDERHVPICLSPLGAASKQSLLDSYFPESGVVCVEVCKQLCW